MSVSALSLEVLPAGYGDCLLVSCRLGKRRWRVRVDTGPEECFPQWQARPAAIAPAAGGWRVIDTFAVTHRGPDLIGRSGTLSGDAPGLTRDARQCRHTR